MSTEAHTFFNEHVLPNYEAHKSDPLDLRLAMNAAVAINQMADHFWHAISPINPAAVFQSQSPKAFRPELSSRNRHWAVLRDVAEAHKHVHLNREGRTVTSSTQSAVGHLGFGVGPYGTGPYDGESLVVTLDEGDVQHFSFLASESVAMWKAMLTPFGATS